MSRGLAFNDDMSRSKLDEWNLLLKNFQRRIYHFKGYTDSIPMIVEIYIFMNRLPALETANQTMAAARRAAR